MECKDCGINLDDPLHDATHDAEGVLLNLIELESISRKGFLVLAAITAFYYKKAKVNRVIVDIVNLEKEIRGVSSLVLNYLYSWN